MLYCSEIITFNQFHYILYWFCCFFTFYLSTYFSNYSVTNNQSTYIGGAPYKDVIKYEADGITTKSLSEQTEPDSDAYNHNGAPYYKYYVMRIPAEYDVDAGG